MPNSSIWPIDRTLSGATTLGQIGLGNNGNEGVLHVSRSSNTGALPSDLARELKKLCNMKVAILPIVIGALCTITKGLLKGLEVGGLVDTIQMTALLRTARILKRVQETWGDLLSLKLQWKPSAKTDVKNSKGVNNNNNNNNNNSTKNTIRNNYVKAKIDNTNVIASIVYAVIELQPLIT